MTNQQHPITPPPELVQQWWDAILLNSKSASIKTQLCAKAAQWGADQELEACCEWLVRNYHNNYPEAGNPLRIDRRPEPPSLKEQALTALRQVGNCEEIDNVTFNTIRKALEALSND